MLSPIALAPFSEGTSAFGPEVCTGPPNASSTRRPTVAPSMVSCSRRAAAMASRPLRWVARSVSALDSSVRRIFSTSSSMTRLVSSE